MDLIGWFQGTRGLVRLSSLLAYGAVAACVVTDPGRTRSTSQPFAALTGADVACFKTCSALQSAAYAPKPSQRCALTRELCSQAVARTSSGNDPVIDIGGNAIACTAALRASCQSGTDCAAYGLYQCQEACEDAWSDEQDAVENGFQP